MNIGTVIRTYRKQRGFTQEELANRLGVTTPAVNKWENGVTLPDITLLAPIARLLGISVDTLLSFREELTDAECREIMNTLWAYLNDGSFADGFAYAQEQLRLYPNCHGLMLWVAQALDAYIVVMPQCADVRLEDFVHDCYVRALDSGDEMIRIGAADALFHSAMREEQYETAEEYLRYFSVENPERKRKQALLYSKTGRTEEACRAYEELLYAGFQTIRMVMQSLYNIAVEQGELDRADYLARKHMAQIDAFDMGDYAKAAVLLDHGAQMQDRELLVEALGRVLDTVKTLNSFMDSPLYAHMQFNPVESGFGARLKETLKRTFLIDERLDFVRDDPRIAKLLG